MVPPLYTSRLFPASAKQEKFHFKVATSGDIDHFDGDPDLDYIADVKMFMKRMLDGWDYWSTQKDFLQHNSSTLTQDFEKKFPFAIQRLNEKSYHTRGASSNPIWARPGTARRMNTPVFTRPEVVHGSTIVNNVRTVTRSDPRRSNEELRLAQVTCYSFKILKLTLNV